MDFTAASAIKELDFLKLCRGEGRCRDSHGTLDLPVDSFFVELFLRKFPS